MAKRTKKKDMKDMTIQELRAHLNRREKEIKSRIAKLERKKRALQKQITKIERKIKPLRDEIAGKAAVRKPKAKKPVKRRKKAGRLKPGALKKTIIQIVKSAKGPVTPKQVRDAIVRKKLYATVPGSLPRIIIAKLKGPEFRKAGKGKYVLRKKTGK